MSTRNSNMRWVKILLTCGCILAAAAIAYATLKQKVEHNSAAIAGHNRKITVVEKATIGQGADIKYIKESVKRIEDKLP